MAVVEDDVFARVAIARGYLSPQQAGHALAWRRSHPDAPPLPALCESYRVMTRAQIDEVLDACATPAGATGNPFADARGTYRRRLLFACLRGAAKAIPVVGGVVEELMRVLDEDSRARFVEVLPEVEDAASAAAAELPPGERARIEGLARDVATRAGVERARAARVLAETIQEAVAAAEVVRRTVGDLETGAHAGPEVRLTVLEGTDKGRVFAFPATDAFVVGRLRTVKIPLAGDAAVSRQHCMIAVCPPEARLTDLSHNGTFVDGQRASGEVSLRSGQTIKVGNTKLRFELTRKGAPAIPPTVEERLAPAQGRRDHPSFPGFAVLGVLGEGGQGVVYKARRSSGELVAIKTLRPDRHPSERDVSKFLREATLGAQIDHPNVVKVFGSGYEDGTFYFVMECVDGPNVDEELRHRGRPFGLAKGIAIVRGALAGVRAAHERGLVHRDIKPSNLLLANRPDGSFVPMLTDFGLMRSFEGAGLSFTRSGEGKGTPAFMPPEQVEHARLAGPVSDVYALGATLYYLVTRQFPFEIKKGMHLLVAVMEGRRVPLRERLPEAPRALEEVLARAMSEAPADRHATVDDLDAALASVQATLPKKG